MTALSSFLEHSVTVVLGGGSGLGDYRLGDSYQFRVVKMEEMEINDNIARPSLHRDN